MTPDEFRAIRKSLGLTQQRWAEALCVRQEYVSDLERGRHKPSATLVRLAEVYEAIGTIYVVREPPT